MYKIVLTACFIKGTFVLENTDHPFCTTDTQCTIHIRLQICENGRDNTFNVGTRGGQ